MKKVFLRIALLSFTIALCSACSNELDDAVADGSQVKDIEVINNGTLLKFKDQATFDAYVAQTKNDASKLDIDKSFTSLADHFGAAMREAESYYDREGGYEEFKAKYSSLYFPEEDDDFSAYLPIGDEVLAKLANTDGNVMIGNEVKNVKDVTTYAQLKVLGKTPPDENQLRATEGTNFITDEYNAKGDRLIWVKSRVMFKYDYMAKVPHLHIEVSFRKRVKVFFKHRWYNYSSISNITVNVSGLDRASAYCPMRLNGASSHDYYFPIQIYTVYNINYYSATNGTILINHQGMDKTLTLTIAHPTGQVGV